jgi:hypothetical protein
MRRLTVAGLLVRVILGVFLAGLTAAGFLWTSWTSVLEITNMRTGQALWRQKMKVGEEFVLSFTHSVNKRPVFDTLRAQGDHIIIVKSRYDAFVAGMPEATTDEGTFAVLPDGWLEWTVNRPVPEIVVRVGRVAGHTLWIQGQEIPLSGLAEPGTALSFRVRKISALSMLKGRCFR